MQGVLPVATAIYPITRLKAITLKNQRINLKSLADHLGISQATVSRALAGHEAISAATRQRVSEAARQLGYQPNASAQRLATGRTNTIGLVFPLERLMLAQTNFVDVLAGLTNGLNKRNYDLIMSPFLDHGEEAVFRRLVAARSVDGIVITRPRVRDVRIPILNGLGLPYVVHGRTETDVPYSYVDIDNESVFAKAAGLLLKLGHRRIATLNGLPEFMYSEARERGFRRALEEYGLAPDPAMQRQTRMVDEAGYAATIELMRLPSPPSAIICGSIFLAKGVYVALKELGLQAGREVSVIAHDDQLRGLHANQFEPSLTATVAPIQEAGEQLAEVLVAKIQGETGDDVLHRVLPVELVVRDSVSACPQQPA